jgi:hypothetical protein
MSDSDHRWMFSAEELAHTPSIRDGMPPAQEKIMRQKSCLFVVEMARLLKRCVCLIRFPSIFFLTSNVFSKQKRARLTRCMLHLPAILRRPVVR